MEGNFVNYDVNDFKGYWVMLNKLIIEIDVIRFYLYV